MQEPSSRTSGRDSLPEPALETVQRWFQSVVTHPDGVDAGVASADAQSLVPLRREELERMVTRSANLTASERLAIYANAYFTRLIECLGETFPVLKRVLGEEVFNGFAFGYLQRHPSRSYTLNRLGAEFARYLAETRPDRSAPEESGEAFAPDWPDLLIDLAALEWTIAEVFDGPGIERKSTLRADDLLYIPAGHWPRVMLRAVPCLRLLHLEFPLNDYYQAVRQAPEDATVPIPAPGETFVAVTRRDFIVRRHSLSRPQYELLMALQQGRSLGEAVDRAASSCSLDDAELGRQLEQWFRNWTAQQFFEAVH